MGLGDGELNKSLSSSSNSPEDFSRVGLGSYRKRKTSMNKFFLPCYYPNCQATGSPHKLQVEERTLKLLTFMSSFGFSLLVSTLGGALEKTSTLFAQRF